MTSVRLPSNVETRVLFYLLTPVPVSPGGGWLGQVGGPPPPHDSVPQDGGVPLPRLLRQQAGPAQEVGLQQVEEDTARHGLHLALHQQGPDPQQEVCELVRLASLYFLSDNVKLPPQQTEGLLRPGGEQEVAVLQDGDGQHVDHGPVCQPHLLEHLAQQVDAVQEGLLVLGLDFLFS